MAYSQFATTTVKTLAALMPPGTPSGLKATPESDRVILRWTESPESTGYVVEWRVGSGQWQEAYSGPNNQATIAGLTPDTEYNLRVKAANAAGDSAWETVTVKTKIQEDGIVIIRFVRLEVGTPKLDSRITGV